MTSYLFTSGKQSLPKMGSSHKRNEFAPVGANSFLYEMTHLCMGGNNEKDRFASPESGHLP